MLRTLGMASRTPKFERQLINEEKVQRVSVSIHVWAYNNRGGIEFLHKFVLTDTILKEIYNYCGPLSNSRLLANISFDELKILWRNPMKSFGYSLGHYLTGFINSRGVHESSKDYCHFGHCASEIHQIY